MGEERGGAGKKGRREKRGEKKEERRGGFGKAAALPFPKLSLPLHFTTSYLRCQHQRQRQCRCRALRWPKDSSLACAANGQPRKENRVSQLTAHLHLVLPPSTDALLYNRIRIVTCRGHFVIAHSLGSRAVLVCCPRLAWLLLRSSLPSALQLYHFHQQRKQVSLPSPPSGTHAAPIIRAALIAS